MSRLLLMKSPEGVEGAKPLAFRPEDVRMIGSINVPEGPSGLKDKDGKPLPPKQVYREDLSAIIVDGLEQPLIVGESVREAVRIINNVLDSKEVPLDVLRERASK